MSNSVQEVVGFLCHKCEASSYSDCCHQDLPSLFLQILFSSWSAPSCVYGHISPQEQGLAFHIVELHEVLVGPFLCLLRIPLRFLEVVNEVFAPLSSPGIYQ